MLCVARETLIDDEMGVMTSCVSTLDSVDETHPKTRVHDDKRQAKTDDRRPCAVLCRKSTRDPVSATALEQPFDERNRLMRRETILGDGND